AHPAEPGAQELEELDLVVRAWSEVRVSPFGRDRNQILAHAREERLAEPRARGDDSRIPARMGDALLNQLEVCVRERRNAVPGRHEVVDQVRGRAEDARHGARVDVPGEV